MGGSGGGMGSGPPLLAHDVGFLTLDPLLDPLFLLVGLRWTPPFKNPGSAPVLIIHKVVTLMLAISYK